MKSFAIHLIVNIGIWLTQSLNVWLFFGYADESVSSRCWRLRRFTGWGVLHRSVDAVALHVFGQSDHCRLAYEAEKNRRQLPPELRA